MLPEFGVRLQTVAKAIEQVIVPALPDDEKLAYEQAMLVLGHLRMMERQWRYVMPAARRERDILLVLAAEIRSCVAAEEVAVLDAAISFAEAADPEDYDAVRAATLALGHVLDGVVRSPRRSGEDERTLRTAVLAHARRQGMIERIWFSGAVPGTTGHDPIAAMFSTNGHPEEV